jgi:hypothetical protein
MQQRADRDTREQVAEDRTEPETRCDRDRDSTGNEEQECEQQKAIHGQPSSRIGSVSY